MKQKKTASILKKFLLFNLIIFSVLGLFTILYLKAIQPNLVKERTNNHLIIISNTSDHIKRLNVKLTTDGIKKFLLSTRFLFQSMNRVQFFDVNGTIIGDTNILDLDQSVFSKSDDIFEENINDSDENKKNAKKINKPEQNIYNENIKELIKKNYTGEALVLENQNKNNFFVSTLKHIKVNNSILGYIMVTEEANDILLAVEERKNFILRTVLAVALVILIFSLFLNKYILKPIGFLVTFTEAIKNKSDKKINIDKFFVREDEVGKLTKSIDEMTKELQKRASRAETFSTDLAHEIRNPLASLKGASELLDKNENIKDRVKLLKIINHDVERIERLITDYSQMLKDEASLSREKMKKIDILNVIHNVVDDFKQDLFNQNKKILINIVKKNENNKEHLILGIENRLEQVIANLLDNAISFSSDNSSIDLEISEISNSYLILIRDEGPGFAESTPKKIFTRFYSNRPANFGKHSGLGLNIVKNIVELHKGTISASNRTNHKGAQIEVLLPKLI